MILIKLLKIILLAQGKNNMEEKNNAQLCENEEKKDESIDISKESNTLKKEPKTPIEFYDIYP